MGKNLFLGLGLLLSMTACSPSASQLQKTLEDNPDILVKAIEKNPDQIMGALQKAAQAAQGKAQEMAAKEEETKAEAEFQNPLKPEIAEDRASMGPKNAAITIVEYTDFQCPFCARGYQTLEAVRKAYGDKVRVIVKNLPLPMHPMAIPAAKRFEALMLQNPEKAWAFYHEVFSNQQKMQDGEKYLDAAAKKAGADMGKLKADINSPKVDAVIKADMAEAEKFGISGTPGFVISGVSLKGAYPIEAFKKIIDRKLAEAK